MTLALWDPTGTRVNPQSSEMTGITHFTYVLQIFTTIHISSKKLIFLACLEEIFNSNECIFLKGPLWSHNFLRKICFWTKCMLALDLKHFLKGDIVWMEDDIVWIGGLTHFFPPQNTHLWAWRWVEIFEAAGQGQATLILPAASPAVRLVVLFLAVLRSKYLYVLVRDGPPPDFSGIPDFFFFYLREKKKPEPGKLTIFFVWEKLAA